MPGFINESWALIEEPGVYRGQCAELCGRNHGFMPIEVKAVEEEEYNRWLAEKKAQLQAQASGANKEWSMEELMAQGETVYNTYCSSCHQSNGAGIPPVFPALAGSDLMKLESGRQEHIDSVLFGRAGTAMSAFGQVLSVTDLAAVITYERNAWGNNSGDTVQPGEITQRLTRGQSDSAKTITAQSEEVADANGSSL